MGEFIKNSPFRFWCQKVLPLVYDDSLSYYELLCKVVGKLNELAENQNNLNEDIKQVAKDLNDFKEQVPGMIEQKVEEWLNNYITTKGLVNSVNGMKGDVTLTAEDVGAIANVNGSVKNNNIAAGAVTADKIAAGVIPTKLPNPQKLTFSGAVTGEYDGSKAVNIDIPAGGGGGGGGAVDSVNGMTGAVVLKKLTVTAGGASVEYNGSADAEVTLPNKYPNPNALTAVDGLEMNSASGYDGAAAQTVGIANDGVTTEKIANNAVTADKLAGGVIPTTLPNPHKLTFTGAASGTYDGSVDKSVNIPTVPSKLPNPKSLTFTGGASATYDGSTAVNVNIPSEIGYYTVSKKVTNQLEITVTIYYNKDYYFMCSVRVNNTATLGAGSSTDVIGSTPTGGPSGSTDEGLCVMVRSDAFTPTYYAYVKIANNQVSVRLKRTEDIPAGVARGSIVFE